MRSLLVLMAIFAVPLAIGPVIAVQAVPSTLPAASVAPSAAPAMQAGPMAAQLEEERSKRQQAEWDKAIAEAKLEVIDAGNSQLQNWIGLYGILITVILAVAGFLTWKAAANAARAEIQDVRNQIEQLLAKAARDADQIEDTVEAVKDMSEEARRLISAMPGTAGRPPSERVRLEVERLATSAAAKPVTERTGSDLRLLIYEAVQKEDWTSTLAFAEELGSMPNPGPDDVAYALFYRGYGLAKLEKFAEAADIYREYLEKCPDDDEDDRASAFNNWGNALDQQARATEGEEQERLWNMAYEKYETALSIKPDIYDALNNWGAALGENSLKKTGSEADSLWKSACEKFEQVLSLQPQMVEALINWGAVLDERARRKIGDESEQLWRKAFEKYAQALKIKPDMNQILGNWSSALIGSAGRKEGEERERILNEAEAMLRRAEEVDPGYGSYNLACVFALRGDAEGAANWLRTGKSKGTNFPECSHIATDNDLGLVRGDPIFLQALKDIGCA